jgi:trans-aconitate methyltransferase
MPPEQGPEFYDARLARVSEPLETSPWLSVYELAASLLPPPPAGPIADIGCGTGRFAMLLFRAGYDDYWGLDFSPARVAEARSYVPQFEFDVADVFEPATIERFQHFRIFTILEVLEHLERDLDVLAGVPAGAQIVLSVPNYRSAGHVRWFDDLDDVRSRYSELVDFTPGAALVEPRPQKPRKKIFLLAGHRR